MIQMGKKRIFSKVNKYRVLLISSKTFQKLNKLIKNRNLEQQECQIIAILLIKERFK